VTFDDWLATAPKWIRGSQSHLGAAYLMLKRIQAGGELRPSRREIDELIKCLRDLLKD
jgi:hypothetical protein